MKYIILALLLLASACTTDKLSCNSNEDCICGGIDTSDQSCFLGNKDYFDKFVDKDSSCPDFCGGIAGHLETRCVESKCKQVPRVSDAEPIGLCKSDGDCIVAGCNSELCVQKVDDEVFSACVVEPWHECLEKTSCGCNDGKCAWDQNMAFIRCKQSASGVTVS